MKIYILFIVFVEAIRKIFNAVIEDNLDGISKNLVGLLREQNDVMIKEAVNKYTQEMKRKWPSYSEAEPVHKETQRSLKDDLKDRLYDIEGQTNSLFNLFEVGSTFPLTFRLALLRKPP
jgi:hypothetical protein